MEYQYDTAVCTSRCIAVELESSAILSEAKILASSSVRKERMVVLYGETIASVRDPKGVTRANYRSF